jgi:hypothetical protein
MYLIHMYQIYLIYGYSYFAFVAISTTLVRVTVCVCNSFILKVNPNIMATKKRKICDEHRFYNNSWVDLYFFVENKGKPSCLICQKIKFFLKSNFFQ